MPGASREWYIAHAKYAFLRLVYVWGMDNKVWSAKFDTAAVGLQWRSKVTKLNRELRAAYRAQFDDES